MPVKTLTTPVPAIPIGVPSQLLQRRPDIAAAERTMAQANALIGVETAAYYPTLSLTGSGGFQSSTISKLFSAPALFWSLGASASETSLRCRSAQGDGRTIHRHLQRRCRRLQANRAHRLSAGGRLHFEPARALAADSPPAGGSGQLRSDTSISPLARYQTGLDPYLNVITAQTTLLTDQQTEVTLRVSEMTAAVQLIQALGGGWQAAQLPAPAQVATQQPSPQQP